MPLPLTRLFTQLDEGRLKLNYSFSIASFAVRQIVVAPIQFGGGGALKCIVASP